MWKLNLVWMQFVMFGYLAFVYIEIPKLQENKTSKKMQKIICKKIKKIKKIIKKKIRKIRTKQKNGKNANQICVCCLL